MGTKHYKNGEMVAKKGEPITQLSVIVRGKVLQQSMLVENTLESGNVIGIPGAPEMEYACNYICEQPTVVYAFDYNQPEDLLGIFEANNQYSNVFFKGALQQLGGMLSLYIEKKKEIDGFCDAAKRSFDTYIETCNHFNREVKHQELQVLFEQDCDFEVPQWQIDYYSALAEITFEKLYTDPRLNAGSILAIGTIFVKMDTEMDIKQKKIQNMVKHLFNEDGEDLLHEFYSILHEDSLEMDFEEEEQAAEAMEDLISLLCRSEYYDAKEVRQRVTDYDIAEERAYELKMKAVNAMDEDHDNVEEVMSYAEMDDQFKEEFIKLLATYKGMPDLLSTNDEVRPLRKRLTSDFYKLYKAAVQHALIDEFRPFSVDLFLHFGYLDGELAGEKARDLTGIETQIEELCEGEQIYTLFTWLKRIYSGIIPPSISELELSIEASLREEVKMGYIQMNEVERLAAEPWRRVEYELDHMYRSTSKVSHGRILTFCPILSAHELLDTVDHMVVTAEKITKALQEIRSVDFSLFYREILFSDEAHGIPREYIQKEYLPDIILLPNTGIRGMMWQATADVHNDSSARFMLPILTCVDMKDIMADLCGRYRWEICKKLQGAHWSDVTLPSLTSEYSDYLQYYRKNFDLSKDMKTKIKSSLVRAKNNYREVFVSDYTLWVQYEAYGSVRVNKVVRSVLFKYCPLSKAYRDKLEANPIYSKDIARYKIRQAKNARHLQIIYDRFRESGGQVNETLQRHLEFNEL